MASASWRYFVAAVLLAAILAVRSGLGRLRVTPREMVGCAALGLLLPALGNGLVSVGEHQGAPSGIAALLVAAVPLWVIVYRRLSGRPTQPAYDARRPARLRRSRPAHHVAGHRG